MSQWVSPALNFTCFTSADATACVTSPLHTVQLRTPAPASNQTLPKRSSLIWTQLSGPHELNSTPPISMFALTNQFSHNLHSSCRCLAGVTVTPSPKEPFLYSAVISLNFKSGNISSLLKCSCGFPALLE